MGRNLRTWDEAVYNMEIRVGTKVEPAPKLHVRELRLCAILRILCASSHCDSDPIPKVPVHVSYSRNIVKSCF